MRTIFSCFRLFLFVLFTFSSLSTVFGQDLDIPDQVSTDKPGWVRLDPNKIRDYATSRVEPTYPMLARSAKVSGSVFIEMKLDEQGNVTSVRATSGHALLRSAAVSAAQSWKFKPVVKDGVALKVTGGIIFNFELPDSTDYDDVDDLENMEQLVLANPNSAEAHLALGEAYRDIDDIEEAVKAVSKAIKLQPDYEEAYTILAVMYKNNERYEESIQTYKKALEYIPQSILILRDLAHTLNRAEVKRHNEAIEVLKRLIQIEPKDVEAHNNIGWAYMQLKQYEDAVPYLVQASQFDPNSGRAFHNLGAAYHHLKRYDDAVAAYIQILTVKPAYYQLYASYRDMGLSYAQMNRFDDAIEACKKGLEINPKFYEGWTFLAWAYHQTAQYESSLETLNKTIKLKPKDYVGHATIADVYAHLDRPKEAEEAFKEAIKLKPDFAQAYFGMAAMLLRQQKPDEAMTVLRQGLRYAPSNANANLLMGAILDHLGRKAEAEAQYRRALEADPDNPRILNSLGYIMVEREVNLEEALKMIERAVKAEPRNGSYIDSLGWAYFKLGKLDEAGRHLTEAAQLRPSPTINEHLGDLYQRLGKQEAAVGAWKKALNLAIEKGQIDRIKSKLADPAKK